MVPGRMMNMTEAMRMMRMMGGDTMGKGMMEHKSKFINTRYIF